MIFDLFCPPQGSRGVRGWGGKNNCAVASPIYVSNSHTKFCWILSNGLGGGSVTDRRTYTLTVGYLVGTYSVRKSSQESVSTQQIPGNFYGINLNLSKLAPLICK